MKKILPFFAILALVLCSPVMAEQIFLDQLIEDDTFIISGDKLFDKFEYDYTGDMPLAEDVTVTSIMDTEGNYGISFQGAFVDLYGGSASDALIRYRVSVLDPSQWISDAHISGNPYVVGSGIVQVSETFIPEEPDSAMSIHHVNPGNNIQLSDTVYFQGRYKFLYVQKDILALALTNDGSAATLSFVDQTFSQVPEPATIVSLLLGLACTVCFARRNRR